MEDLEKRSPNICSHVHAKGWIVPDDVSLAVFSVGARRLRKVWFECESMIVSASDTSSGTIHPLA